MEAQEILQDIVFVILYGGVMGLSVAAAIYLLLRRGNAIAPGVTPPLRLRLWAAAIMLENVISHVCWLWYFGHPSVQAYILVSAQDIRCHIIGTGTINVAAEGAELAVRGSGTGQVNYLGTPSNLKIRKLGPVKVNKMDP